MPGEYRPIPAALVQKEQLGLIAFNPETRQHEIRRRLPLRLPKATFAEIRRYLHVPADLTRPASGEVPTAAEVDPFSDKFSREQLEYMRLAAKIEANEEQGEFPPNLATAPKRTAAPTTLVELLTACSTIGVNAEALSTKLGVTNLGAIKDIGAAWKIVNNGNVQADVGAADAGSL